MNFEKELKKRKTNIRACSVQSDIPYATLYPIIKGRVDIGTCSYFTVAKLARFLGYRPDEIVYEKERHFTWLLPWITSAERMISLCVISTTASGVFG